MRIKDMSISNRPRERLLKFGVGVLSDAELLAVILQKGTSEDNAIDMCNKLLSRFPIEKLSGMSLAELQQIKGIGPAKAAQIKAAFEFGKRSQASRHEGKTIENAKDVYAYVSPKMSGLDREHFMVLLLDTKNKVVKEEIVSIGSKETGAWGKVDGVQFLDLRLKE